MKITYASPFENEKNTYLVLGDFSNIRIRGEGNEIAYTTKDFGDSKKVEFTIPKGTRTLSIEFYTKELIFRNENAYSFQTYFNPPDNVSLLSIEIELPEGYSLYRNFISPENSKITSDGKRINFSWNFSNKTRQIPISLAFYASGQNDYPAFYAFVFLSVIAIVCLIYYFKKRVKKEFLAGFTEEEKKVIGYLSENKTTYQDKISRQFGFTRAKTTRMMKMFEERGLIERVPVGRKNRVIWFSGKKRKGVKNEEEGNKEQKAERKDATGWENYS